MAPEFAITIQDHSRLPASQLGQPIGLRSFTRLSQSEPLEAGDRPQAVGVRSHALRDSPPLDDGRWLESSTAGAGGH
jgi:hypothetical protein